MKGEHPMKLYMVRHGQSETNLSKKYTGWAQVNLTEQGYEDARRAGKYLQKLSFDRIYSSDLIRAVQTAKTALPGCEPIQLPVLREYDVGELAGQYFVDCAAKYGPDFQINRAQSNFYPYGGENHDMVAKRAQEFLDMLAADPADNVVAFSHAGLIRIALELVVGTRLKNVRCNNCSVAIFAYENGEWYLEGWGIQG